MDSNYRGYEIECFEAGTNLWHARVRRADRRPVSIDGGLFAEVQVGFAWPDREAALADAKREIDRARDFWIGPAEESSDIQPFL